MLQQTVPLKNDTIMAGENNRGNKLGSAGCGISQRMFLNSEVSMVNCRMLLSRMQERGVVMFWCVGEASTSSSSRSRASIYVGHGATEVCTGAFSLYI